MAGDGADRGERVTGLRLEPRPGADEARSAKGRNRVAREAKVPDKPPGEEGAAPALPVSRRRPAAADDHRPIPELLEESSPLATPTTVRMTGARRSVTASWLTRAWTGRRYPEPAGHLPEPRAAARHEAARLERRPVREVDDVPPAAPRDPGGGGVLVESGPRFDEGAAEGEAGQVSAREAVDGAVAREDWPAREAGLDPAGGLEAEEPNWRPPRRGGPRPAPRAWRLRAR